MVYKAHEKGLEFTFGINPGTPVHLMGDPVRLRQILINLIGNAIKFTHHGGIVLECGLRNADCGTVVLATQDRDSEPEGEEVVLQFSVRDTGIGISQSKQTAIFESFTQADSSTTRKYGGTGLGLTICKRLVEMMGGEIRVESLEGKGSVFSFTVPFGKNSGHSKAQEPKGLVPPGMENGDSPSQKSGQDEMGGETSKIRPLHILVVEDARENLIVVKAFLKKSPHILDIAENGKIAVEKYVTGKYDLVLMDMRMPVMDGYTATVEIRKWEQDKQKTAVPVIALTANALLEDRQKCLDAGCTDYLSKPIKRGDLLKKISEYA